MGKIAFASLTVTCLALVGAAAIGIICGCATAEGAEPAPAVPRVMLYEGYLTDTGGNPLPDGLHDFTFALYTDPAGDSPVWTESHRKVKVTNGLVQVHLGRGTPARALDIPFDRQYFLGVSVDDGQEMTPRLELLATAYSFRAGVADEVPDASVTTEKLAPLSVTDDKIKDVSWEKIVGAPDVDKLGAEDGTSKAVPSAVWHTKGNTKTDPEKDYIGTADEADLAFRTDGQERMRIMSDGKIVMKSALLVEDYITSRKTADEGGFLLCDPEHGLKRVGNDDVRLFTTGGNLLLEGGRVGIGAESPEAALHIHGTSNDFLLNVESDLRPGLLMDAAGRTSFGGPFATAAAMEVWAYGGDAILELMNGDGETRLIVHDDGQLVLISDKPAVQAWPSSYPLYISTEDQGISIETKGSADASNNYVAFFDEGGMVGRIEGMNAVDQLTDPEYIMLTVLDVFELTMALIDEAAALASENICAGVGAVGCPPIASLIIGAGLKIAECAVRTAAVQTYTFLNLGVSYQSGSGDYAEWLERLDEVEHIEPGDIVGVFGGKVTRTTEGAQQILCISHSPIVLGNMPSEGEEDLYEKVAFLGQVPVKVIGPVNQGDYIIPSGLEDGTGIAVAPEMMTADEYAKAVGRAWSASDNQVVKLVNVAVGLNQADIARLVRKQQAELDALKVQVASGARDALQARAELDRLMIRVTALGGLQQEMMELRTAVDRLERETQAGGLNMQAAAASGASPAGVKR